MLNVAWLLALNSALINPFKPNGNSNRRFCKQTVNFLIRHHIMWCLIWNCTVCLCPIKRTLGFYGLREISSTFICFYIVQLNKNFDQLFASLMLLLLSADFFQNELFQKLISGTKSECQTIWMLCQSWSGFKLFAKFISRRLFCRL